MLSLGASHKHTLHHHEPVPPAVRAFLAASRFAGLVVFLLLLLLAFIAALFFGPGPY